MTLHTSFAVMMMNMSFEVLEFQYSGDKLKLDLENFSYYISILTNIKLHDIFNGNNSFHCIFLPAYSPGTPPHTFAHSTTLTLSNLRFVWFGFCGLVRISFQMHVKIFESVVCSAHRTTQLENLSRLYVCEPKKYPIIISIKPHTLEATDISQYLKLPKQHKSKTFF